MSLELKVKVGGFLLSVPSVAQEVVHANAFAEARVFEQLIAFGRALLGGEQRLLE